MSQLYEYIFAQTLGVTSDEQFVDQLTHFAGQLLYILPENWQVIIGTDDLSGIPIFINAVTNEGIWNHPLEEQHRESIEAFRTKLIEILNSPSQISRLNSFSETSIGSDDNSVISQIEKLNISPVDIVFAQLLGVSLEESHATVLIYMARELMYNLPEGWEVQIGESEVGQIPFFYDSINNVSNWSHPFEEACRQAIDLTREKLNEELHSTDDEEEEQELQLQSILALSKDEEDVDKLEDLAFIYALVLGVNSEETIASELVEYAKELMYILPEGWQVLVGESEEYGILPLYLDGSTMQSNWQHPYERIHRKMLNSRREDLLAGDKSVKSEGDGSVESKGNDDIDQPSVTSLAESSYATLLSVAPFIEETNENTKKPKNFIEVPTSSVKVASPSKRQINALQVKSTETADEASDSLPPKPVVAVELLPYPDITAHKKAPALIEKEDEVSPPDPIKIEDITGETNEETTENKILKESLVDSETNSNQEEVNQTEDRSVHDDVSVGSVGDSVSIGETSNATPLPIEASLEERSELLGVLSEKESSKMSIKVSTPATLGTSSSPVPPTKTVGESMMPVTSIIEKKSEKEIFVEVALVLEQICTKVIEQNIPDIGQIETDEESLASNTSRSVEGKEFLKHLDLMSQNSGITDDNLDKYLEDDLKSEGSELQVGGDEALKNFDSFLSTVSSYELLERFSPSKAENGAIPESIESSVSFANLNQSSEVSALDIEVPLPSALSPRAPHSSDSVSKLSVGSGSEPAPYFLSVSNKRSRSGLSMTPTPPPAPMEIISEINTMKGGASVKSTTSKASRRKSVAAFGDMDALQMEMEYGSTGKRKSSVVDGKTGKFHCDTTRLIFLPGDNAIRVKAHFLDVLKSEKVKERRKASYTRMEQQTAGTKSAALNAVITAALDAVNKRKDSMLPQVSKHLLEQRGLNNANTSDFNSLEPVTETLNPVNLKGIKSKKLHALMKPAVDVAPYTNTLTLTPPGGKKEKDLQKLSRGQWFTVGCYKHYGEAVKAREVVVKLVTSDAHGMIMIDERLNIEDHVHMEELNSDKYDTRTTLLTPNYNPERRKHATFDPSLFSQKKNFGFAPTSSLTLIKDDMPLAMSSDIIIGKIKSKSEKKSKLRIRRDLGRMQWVIETDNLEIQKISNRHRKKKGMDGGGGGEIPVRQKKKSKTKGTELLMSKSMNLSNSFSTLNEKNATNILPDLVYSYGTVTSIQGFGTIPLIASATSSFKPPSEIKKPRRLTNKNTRQASDNQFLDLAWTLHDGKKLDDKLEKKREKRKKNENRVSSRELMRQLSVTSISSEKIHFPSIERNNNVSSA